MAQLNKSGHGSTGRGRRVLLAWEMGEGLGHANRLLTLARLLQEQHWTPVVAARDPGALAERYAAANIAVIPTPRHHSCFSGPGRFQAASFADVMGVCGYADRLQLARTVEAWDAVLREYSPQLVITDYSPLLSLAAFGRVPLIAVGDGFVTPPSLADGNFPLMGAKVAPVWEVHTLLDSARWVQAKRGLPLPASLPQIMTGAGQITTVPRELDIYATQRPLPSAGPWQKPPPPLPIPPQPLVFAYLRMDQLLARQVLQVLIDCCLPCECYLRDMNAEMAAVLIKSNIKVHLTPPSLREVLMRSSLLIHHGGIGTLEEALLAGRPQLLLPRHVEQILNARQAMAAKAGVYSVPRDAPLGQVRDLLLSLARNVQAFDAAHAAAARICARQETGWQALQDLLANVVPAPANSAGAVAIENTYAHGNRMHRQGRLAEAEQIYEAVLSQVPAHIGARADRANARRDLGDFAGAEADLRSILATHPKHAKILQSLGHLLRIEGRLEEAAACLRQALEEEETAARHWQLAYTLLLMGRYRDAWPHFEYRHQALGLRTAHPAKPRWDGKPLTTTLLVVDEQGLGDTLQFLRFLPLIPLGRGGRIIFAGKPATLPLVQRMLSPEDVFPWDGALPPSHTWIPLMSLPARLGIMAPEDIPPPTSLHDLLIDTRRISKWRTPVRGAGDCPVVALCWRGNPDFSGDIWRSPGLAALVPLLEVEGVRFVSLQIGPGRREINELGLQQTITDLGGRIETEGAQVLDTLAALASCDFVITSCTSIAHMAGLAAVPGCVLLSTRPDWRWMMGRADSPWYPSLQLLRQSSQGDWTAVVAEAKKHVQAWRSR